MASYFHMGISPRYFPHPDAAIRINQNSSWYVESGPTFVTTGVGEGRGARWWVRPKKNILAASAGGHSEVIYHHCGFSFSSVCNQLQWLSLHFGSQSQASPLAKLCLGFPFTLSVSSSWDEGRVMNTVTWLGGQSPKSEGRGEIPSQTIENQDINNMYL